MTTYVLTNPNAAVGTVAASRSGNTYTVAAGGIVTGVAQTDLRDLEAAGWCVQQLNPVSLPLLSARNADGSTLAAAAAAGKFGWAVTLGTSDNLISEVATSGTKTDTVLFDFTLPNDYPAGTNLVLDVNANTVLTAGATLTTSTLEAHAYAHPDARVSGNGASQTADLIASGNTITLTATATDFTFTVAGAALVPGERIIAEGIVKLVESGGTAAHANINYVEYHT